ncbi:MAG: sigma-70 family RNA polymerase sigma factor [Acidobacteriales bacterium]|nr:sigma-70 family RNA polymerase sigma factor [Terriglobales bacterium]
MTFGQSHEAGVEKNNQDRRAADTDTDLVRSVLQGDARAFEDLVRRHEKRVYRVTIAITGNEADAEEALQDTFLKAFRKLGEFRGESRFTTWLTRIAINEGLLRRRSRKATVSLDEPELDAEVLLPKRLEPWYADPEKRYAHLELRRIVHEAILELADGYRIVFILRDVEGLTTAETAEALGLQVPAVKSRLLRARLKMRHLLSKRLAQPATLKSGMMRAMLVVQDAVTVGVGALRGKGKSHERAGM